MPNLEDSKRAPASAGILDIIAQRWSPRAFTTQPVSEEDPPQDFYRGLLGRFLGE